MDFQTLKYHLEDYGCSVDHLEDILYGAINCINGHYCEIEDLPIYSHVTLSHYCFELGVPSLPGYEVQLDKYRHFRNNVVKIPLEGEPGE